MCKENVGWDDPLSEDLATRWNRWLGELRALADIKIQRHVAPKEFGDIVVTRFYNINVMESMKYGYFLYQGFYDFRGVHCFVCAHHK